MPRPSRQQRLAGFDDEIDSASTPAEPLPAPAPANSAGNAAVEPTEMASPVELVEAAEAEILGETLASPAETHLASQGSDLPLAGKKVYVVDSHSLIFQVFHVIAEMTGPNGQPTNAIYGFTRDMLFLLDQRKPDYLICAFDHSGHTFRHELYPEYKAGRDEMPSELRPQIPNIKRVLAALGIPVMELENFEADDLLATIAREVEEQGGECVLVTGDKDCRQLITAQTVMYNIRKNELLDAAAVETDWGVRPDQVVDFQALVGDPTDNVPGVRGIGKKTAATLLQKFGTLDQLLVRLNEVSAKAQREKLEQGADMARTSRDLVKLDANVPIAIDWLQARVGGINREDALALFHEFGFRAFAERIAALQTVDAPKGWVADYRIVRTPAEFAALVDELKRQSHISFDTETTHTNPRFAQLVGLSFAWEEGVAYYVPVRGPAGEEVVDLATAVTALKAIFEDPAIAKVGQNVKYDIIVLRGVGIDVQGVSFDTMLADYLLEAGARNHSLDELARRYLNHENIKISELIGTGKNQKCMDEVPVAQVGPYAAEDADVALRLVAILNRRLKDEQLEPLFHEVEVPLIEALVECEFNGIKVDVPRLAELSVEYGERMQKLEAEIHATAGREFNIGSPKQLAEVLFDELKLPVIKKTKTGRSTDVEVLEELATLRDRPGHELAAKIVEYRQFAKLKGTYLDALPQLVLPQTGRIHTSLNQVVAATGRLSSNDPNLQNIPIRTAEGREIRSAFVPGEPNWLLLAADYSQIELRILAHFSQDETLSEAFARDEDIHARVASEVYGVPLDAVTSEYRRRAKAINFGIVYGQSPFGLAKALDIEKEEAAAFIEAYFARYPGVAELIDRILDQCRKDGFVTTILGRRRKIDGVRSASDRGKNSLNKNLPERTAVNTVIQGSAADLIKVAMINVLRRMRREQVASRMLLQIHDELLFETPPGEVETLAALVREEMSSAQDLDVPLKVDVKTGPNWAACERMN